MEGAVASDEMVGQTIGKYRIEGLLGEGGMGQVYRATHTVLGQPAAVKLLNHQFARNAGVVKRFFNEARAAAKLRHANIVEVYDFDTLPDGRPYMILEFLEGEPLSRKLQREGRMEPLAAFQILAQVCAAVGAAHAASIIHRDLKPDNIYLLARAGAEGVVKVLDFGIAKLLDEGQAGGQGTRTGMILGTPEYMSPEQAMGDNEHIGPASDIYSIGVIAYHMLSGQVPFPGDALSFARIALKHASEPPPPLRTARPDLPPAIEAVVHRALAKEIPQRWRSTAEFAQAFAQALDPAQAEGLLASLGAVGASMTAMASGPAMRSQGYLSSPVGPSTPRPTTLSGAATATGAGRSSQVSAPPASRRSALIGASVAAVVVIGVIVVAVVGGGKKKPPAPAPPIAVPAVESPVATKATTTDDDWGTPAKKAPAPVASATQVAVAPAIGTKSLPAPHAGVTHPDRPAHPSTSARDAHVSGRQHGGGTHTATAATTTTPPPANPGGTQKPSSNGKPPAPPSSIWQDQ